MARKATEFVQFKLRVREALRKKIEREATLSDHSANAEAVERLERSFERDTTADRDHALLALMLGGHHANGGLLRDIAFELQKDPDWYLRTADDTEAMVKKIEKVVRQSRRAEWQTF